MPRLPVVSAQEAVQVFGSLGWEVDRHGSTHGGHVAKRPDVHSSLDRALHSRAVEFRARASELRYASPSGSPIGSACRGGVGGFRWKTRQNHSPVRAFMQAAAPKTMTGSQWSAR